MNYIGNDIYEIEINGQTVQCSAEQLREAFIDIKTYEKSEVNDYVETCPFNYIYEDSGKYELLITEIKDSAFKGVEWSDELEMILDNTVDAAFNTAHNWYTSLYYMERKI